MVHPVIVAGVGMIPFAKPGASEPGAPAFPPGGVIPPDPEKYGTFAARWLYSQRNVVNWLGM